MHDVLEFAGVMAVLMGTVFGSYAMFVTIKRWEKRNEGATPKELAAVHARLGNLEQAVDAIAIELERVAEGQRFTTKLLTERVSAGDAPPAGAIAPQRALEPVTPATSVGGPSAR